MTMLDGDDHGVREPATWRRALRCSPAGDNCVEVRLRGRVVDIRDSKAVDRVITIGRSAWRDLLDGPLRPASA